MIPYAEKPGAVRRKASYQIGRNARIKTFPDGSQDVLVCEAPIFGFAGWEEERRASKARRAEKSTSDPQRAIRRAKAQVREIAMCTPFKYFVTLTLDQGRVDRYDMKEITRHLNHWLDNQVRRKGLCYVLVPERHKDGAIHFHGFFNEALPATDSGTMVPPGGGKPRRPRGAAQAALWAAQGGHRVYNLPGWGWGFSTAIELYGEYSKAVGYVCKYIGKDQGEKIGGRWYYSGGQLGRPEVSYCDLSLEELAGEKGSYRFSVREAGLGFVMKHYEGGVDNGNEGRVSAGGGDHGLYGGVPKCGVLPEGGTGGVHHLSGAPGGGAAAGGTEEGGRGRGEPGGGAPDLASWGAAMGGGRIPV